MSYLDELFKLEGKAALVTGAARGIGLTLARALASSGVKVVLTDILDQVLSDSVNRLLEAGLEVTGLPGDITDPDFLVGLPGRVEEKYGRLDILVNNAGITLPGEVFSYPAENWDRTYEVNLKAPFELSRQAALIMKKGAGGSIINLTSINAELAFPGNPAYVCFKGALKQLTKALALDLGAHGVRVNNVGPGYIRTSMTGRSWQDEDRRRTLANRSILGRWGEPEDLVGAVLFLASEASAFITGQDIYVDGGWLVKGL